MIVPLVADVALLLYPIQSRKSPHEWNLINEVRDKFMCVYPDLKRGGLIAAVTVIGRIDTADFSMNLGEAKANIERHCANQSGN